MARTGRRRGNPDTRETILDAAATAFAARGYDSTSIRHIAAAAEVDPALIHHYFGTKEDLFLAAVRMPINPAKLIPDVVTGGIDGAGERLVRTFLTVWDSPAGTAAAALVRSAVSHERSTRMLREFLTTRVLRRAMKALDVPDSPVRASLVASQIIGLAMTRYIVKIEPLANLPREQVVALVAPTIQRYLTGDLPAEVLAAATDADR